MSEDSVTVPNITAEFIEEPKPNFWHWKRVVHIFITLCLIVFLIWYYLPENSLIRKVDTCGYYAGKNNLTCQCISKEGPSITTTFYPNYSYKKNIPKSKSALMDPFSNGAS